MTWRERSMFHVYDAVQLELRASDNDVSLGNKISYILSISLKAIWFWIEAYSIKSWSHTIFFLTSIKRMQNPRIFLSLNNCLPWGFLTFLMLRYSCYDAQTWGNDYLIICWISKFAHLQRNKQVSSIYRTFILACPCGTQIPINQSVYNKSFWSQTKELPEDTRDKIIYPYTVGMSYKTIRKMFGEKVTTVAAISSLASLQTSVQ